MNAFAMNPTVMRSFLIDSSITYAPTSVIVRPVQANDIDPILEMHQRLSDDSLYKRYHTPRVPSRKELNPICQLNDENGRAFVAVTSNNYPMIVGMAYYIVTGWDSAEAAFLVEDRYQGQGIGKQLMRCLKRQAVVQGIRYFDASVLPSNQPMIHLLRRNGRLVHNKSGYGSREMRIQL